MMESLKLLTKILISTVVIAGISFAQTITVWAWNIAVPAIESSIESFQEMNPGVEVVVEDLGNQNVFDRGLAGCAAGGFEMPDLYLIENNEAEIFWSQFPDCFVDLATLGAEELLPLFPDFKWTELIVDGAIYAIPWDSGPTTVFYRRDLYEQAGISADEIQTWDDFIAAGEKVLEATDGTVKMGVISIGSDDEWFRMIANQAGCFYFDVEGQEVTVNQPGCVLALETVKKLVDAGVIAVGGWPEQIQLFQNNNLASSVYGSWYGGTIQSEAPEQAGLWGAYPPPALEPGGVRASNIGGSSFAIPSSSENQELTYEFAKNFLANADNQITSLRDYGLTPSLLSTFEEAYISEPVDFYGGQAVWQDILATLGEVLPARGTQFFSEARDVTTAAISDYINGGYDSAQEALDQAARQISQATGVPIAQ
ncbi:MAG: sugar ABC transporter substrate-binding protein [Deinococcota bacterium]